MKPLWVVCQCCSCVTLPALPANDSRGASSCFHTPFGSHIPVSGVGSSSQGCHDPRRHDDSLRPPWLEPGAMTQPSLEARGSHHGESSWTSESTLCYEAEVATGKRFDTSQANHHQHESRGRPAFSLFSSVKIRGNCSFSNCCFEKISSATHLSTSNAHLWVGGT